MTAPASSSPSRRSLSRHEITRLLGRWGGGDRAALDELMEEVYGELQQLARGYLARERADHSLETRALIHEAFLRLIDQEEIDFTGRRHFFGIAARTMRRILVDHARRHAFQKRGGGQKPLPLKEHLYVGPMRPDELVALDEALTLFAQSDPERARLVELRFFGGFTHGEIAEIEGVSIPTIDRRWRTARAWLFDALRRDSADESAS